MPHYRASATTPVEMAELSLANSPAKQPILRYRRFHGWDYSKGASFFITIVTEPRRSLFGRVEQGAMMLSPLGEKVMAVEHYIANNPLKWWLMYCDKTLMRVQEPLDSPLLDGTGIFWRGVGNTDLITPAMIGPNRRIVSMRISRKVPASLLTQVAAGCLKGANAGYIYASTFFSPGERQLYNALAEAGAPMIKLQTSKIGWGYRPVGSEPELFAAKRLLILAPMLAPATPSTRPELLDANRHAATIAHACDGGKAIYVVPGGGGVEYRHV